MITLSLALASSALATHTVRDGTWPNGPFVTSGRWITDASGVNVTYAGVNWPASADAMIPEGLQYRSIEDIVSKIKSLGMNSIRLTYAIEMIDQIYDNGNRDITIYDALVDAIGEQNGPAVYDKIVEHNPSFNKETTRLQVRPFPVFHPTKQGPVLTMGSLEDLRCGGRRVRKTGNIRPPR